MLEAAEPREREPDAVIVPRETIELAFVAAIQHLTPRPRAVLLLRDVLGWPANEITAMLDMSVPAVNGALHRARSMLRATMPERRLDWTATKRPTSAERDFVRRYMDALDRADLATVAELLADDVRTTMPPRPMWFEGRRDVMRALAANRPSRR
jgi:RNA polymerase sigma-70 factor, ECF subfamily